MGEPVPRKKRRLIVDSLKVIPNAEFKNQLQNTSDIVGKIDLAPASKKAMHYLTYGGVGKFFAYPGRRIQSAALAKMFFRHLTMVTEVKESSAEGLKPLDPELKTPEYYPQTVAVNNGMVHHMFGDAVAKRNANSFDYLIKGMHIRPNVPRSKERTKRTEQPAVVAAPIPVSINAVSTVSTSLPVQYEIVDVKPDASQGDLSSIPSVVYTPIQGVTEETMLVGIDCNFESTNKIGGDIQIHNVSVVHEPSEMKIDETVQEQSNIVYTIAPDQSVVIKSEDAVKRLTEVAVHKNRKPILQYEAGN